MENFIPTKEQIKAGLEKMNSINTEEQLSISLEASKLAKEVVESNSFNVEKFNEKYNDGVSQNNISFGYQFAAACVDNLLQRELNEIKQKLPMVMQTLSHLNDSAFTFSLEFFKNKFELFHREYKEQPKLFIDLVKDSLSDTPLKDNLVVQNILGETKEKATKNISSIRENTFSLPDNNKLQNK